MAKHEPTILDRRLTAEDVRDLVFSPNKITQDRFAKNFSGDIRKAIAELRDTYNAYFDLQKRTSMKDPHATVLLFVYSAINTLITSLHLQVSGFPVPAGHLMRQFGESVAMAMLCADPNTGVFALYDRDREKYPVHKSVDKITQTKISDSLRKTLNLNPTGWGQLKRLAKLYEQLSHASALSLGFIFMYGVDGGLVLGSQWDPKKRRQYRSEIVRLTSAARVLRQLIEVLGHVLPRREVRVAAR